MSRAPNPFRTSDLTQQVTVKYQMNWIASKVVEVTGSRTSPLPKTTEECTQLLELILDLAESSSTRNEETALKAVERLSKRRCAKALIYIVHEFRNETWGQKARIAEKAREYI